jgi:hypothetical protein
MAAVDPEGVNLVNEQGGFTDMFESTITDIFKKFDLIITNSIDFKEFNDFLGVIGKPKMASDIEFKNQILSKHTSTENALTLAGFKEWWISEIDQQGPDAIWAYLDKLGYDKDLYSTRSRRFNITFHSKSLDGAEPVEVKIRDAIGTDIDNIASQMILKEFGKDVKRCDGYRIVEYFSP